jgi:uroporphyrin-III C-methyltransferase
MIGKSGTSQTDDFPPGSVWLVGAGQGDPELLTRKAEPLIRSASVIFHDALVGSEIVAMATPGTRLIYVANARGAIRAIRHRSIRSL